MFSKRSFVRESGSCNFSNAKNVLRPCLRLSAATAAAVVLLSGTPAWAAVHTVVPGESLWSISRLYGTTVEELQAANNLKGDLLMPGQKLTVPEKVVSAPAAAATATAQKAPAPAPKAPAPQVRHTVQDGETLHGIGQKYSVSPEAIMAANKLQSDLIHPGQVLVIPVVDSAKDKRVTAELSRGGTDRGDSEMLLSFATSLLGRPYRYGASGPSAFDCSGFTAYVFSQWGHSLPHNAAGQAAFGQPVGRDALEPGDLVFFGYYGSRDIRHVGIYVGGNRFIHASTSGGVKYSSLAEAYYSNNYKGARRLL